MRVKFTTFLRISSAFFSPWLSPVVFRKQKALDNSYGIVLCYFLPARAPFCWRSLGNMLTSIKLLQGSGFPISSRKSGECDKLWDSLWKASSWTRKTSGI